MLALNIKDQFDCCPLSDKFRVIFGKFFLRRPQLRLHIVKGPVKGFIAHVGEGGHVGLEKAF